MIQDQSTRLATGPVKNGDRPLLGTIAFEEDVERDTTVFFKGRHVGKPHSDSRGFRPEDRPNVIGGYWCWKLSVERPAYEDSGFIPFELKSHWAINGGLNSSTATVVFRKPWLQRI